jgi:glutathione S-transferase
MRRELPAGTDAVFVVNRTGDYHGCLFITKLITSDPDQAVSQIMDTDVPAISATMEAAQVAMLFENYDLVSAAVVDEHGKLVGRITVDDVVDVIREEASHSVMSMAGLDEDDDMFAPVGVSARRRSVWLGVNLATAFLAAWVAGLFEATLAQVVTLAILMPVVPSMGGIAGNQLFESGAILIYLAEKTGQFLPADPAQRYETLQWLMFQMGGVGPMFGQLGFFHKFAGKDYEDKRPRDRYAAESKRLLNVLNQRMTGRTWLMGDDYTIADIAIWPWVRNLVGFYGAGDLVGFQDFPELKRVLESFEARPAVQRGLNIPARG